MSKNSFFSEFFSVPNLDDKNTPFQPLHVLSSTSLVDSSQEINEMLQKIVSLCGADGQNWSHSTVESPFEISQVLQDETVQTILCFVEKQIIDRLHVLPSNTGFQEINGKKIIFLPTLGEFATNQQAKKYLWSAMKKTFPTS